MKRALLIGNQNYNKLSALSSPHNDVKKIKNVLEAIGFCVESHLECKYKNIKELIEEFNKSISDGDEVVFYFSGHGYSFKGHNYILPIDCLDFSEIDYGQVVLNSYEDVARVIDITMVSNGLSDQNINGINILLMDACRNIIENKVFNDRRIENFVEIPIQTNNVFISYAATLGEQAKDNSVYATAISKLILRKFQTLDELFNCIANYVINEGFAQMPTVNKIDTNSYCFVDESNYCIEVEKQYYEELLYIYKYVLDKFPNQNEEDEILKNIIYKSVKYSIYLSPKLLNEYIKKVITAKKQGIGIIYLLLKDDNFTRVDVHKNAIFIEAKFGDGYSFDNDSYYDFKQCVEFIKKFDQKSEGVYCYKDKTIYMPEEAYFQIINCEKNESLSALIYNPISKIALEDNSIDIKKLIVNYIERGKNILVVGEPFTNKEELVSAFSEYFSESDKILSINEDKIIDIRKGQISKNSTNFDELECMSQNELNNYVNLLCKENINIIIYQNKAFRENEEIYQTISQIGNCQFIMTHDCYVEHFISKLNMSKNEMLSKFDLIIVLRETKAVGGIVDSVYEKSGSEFVCSIDVEIDYDKLSLLNEKLHMGSLVQ